MSDTPPDKPQLNDLLNALNELSWGEVKEVALQLGVAFPKLRQVEGHRTEFIERLQDSMHFWLSSDKVRPTWARLVTALRRSDKATLAETVEQKYCKAVETPSAIQPLQNLSSPHSPPLTESATVPPPPNSTTAAVSSSVNLPLLPSYTTASFPPPHSTDLTPSHRSTSISRPKRHVRRPSPPSRSPLPSSPPQSHHPTLEATQPADLPGLQGRSAQPHPAQVRRELSRLQTMFSSVLAHTKTFLIKKEKKSDDVLTDFCTYLTTLPLAPGMLLLKEKEKKIENAKSVRAIFSILKLYWNYSNYYLLQALTKEYGDSPLQQEMENYVADLHRFEKATSVQTFKSVKKNWEHPPKLKKAILTLGKDEAELTLYEIRQLIEDIANEAAIEAYAVYPNGICCSAVVLTLAFPHDGLELFASALSPKFLAKQQITSVVIDGLPLEKYTQEYVKVNRCMKKWFACWAVILVINMAMSCC